MSVFRFYWADNLKAFLIILVVLGHVIQYSYSDYDVLHIYNYIYSFHMPLFMAISGYFSYKNDWAEKSFRIGIRKRTIQLLLPFFVWSVLLCLVEGLSLIDVLFTNPFYWFLLLLFVIYLLMCFCLWLSMRLNIKEETVCLLMMVLLYIIQGIAHPQILSFSILPVHFVFFNSGWFLRKFQDRIKDWVIIPMFILFCVSGFYYKRNLSPGLLSFLPASLYFLITGLSGSLLFYLFLRKYGDSSCKLFSFIGQNTLGLYVSHLFLCYVFQDEMKSFVQQVGLFSGISILFVVCVIICSLFVYILSRSVIRPIIGLTPNGNRGKNYY